MAYDKSGGILFPIKSENPKAPLYEGSITLVKNDLRDLIALAKEGNEIKMRVVTFRHQGQKGPFLSMAISSWAAHEKERADYQARKNGDGGQSDSGGDTDVGSSDPWDL